MKVALVYDRINKWGGAERVLLAFKELFPNAPLFTSVYNPLKAGWAKIFDIRTSFLQKFPGASLNHEKYAPFMPFAFESFSFEKFDLVISVTSEAAKGIITSPKTKHICYCLTPTRYLWSGHEEYFQNKLFKYMTKPAVSYLRKWDKMASHRPDHFIAISKEVQKRIKEYYGRESVVIYPPVQLSVIGSQLSDEGMSVFSQSVTDKLKTPIQSGKTGKLNSENRKQKTDNRKSEYFLIVSRLVPYKKIDIAIKAFNKLKLPLKIIGTGSEEKRLKKMAAKNIEFLGNLTDTELLRYYKDSSALVFPGIEDFGLVILEALSFGKPVIAFKGGGALETVISGKTGEFFYPQNEDSLVKVINNFRSKKFKPADCASQAKKFSKDRFKKEFVGFIDNMFNNW